MSRTALVLLFLAMTPVQAQDKPDVTRQCAETAERVINAVDGKFEGGNKFGGKVILAGSVPTYRLHFWCGHGSEPHYFSASVSWEGIGPPPDYWDLIAKAGVAVTGEAIEIVRTAVRQCEHEALQKGSFNLGQIATGKAQVECSHRTRDGGSNHTVVFPSRPSRP